METLLAGHYQIIKHLGGGGFGQTFLARDNHLPGNPWCVVKQLKPQFNDPEALATAKRLFAREAETLYRLGTHDQIPRLLAHFEEDGEFYLVQEFVEGQPLNQEIIPGKQLNESEVIALLQNILQVLAFVHQQNVIHRDIKPANLIRRSSDSKIVLIDFGAVKAVSTPAARTHGQTSFTVAIGSPGYMPSEQQFGQPHFSSDIYAVGMLCLQALSGLNPSSHEESQKLPKDVFGEFCCAACGDRICVSPSLASILDKMVRYDYRQRYKNATEALQAVEQLLKQAGQVGYATPTVPMPTQAPRRLTLDEPEGQVSLVSAFYVERPPIESDCYEAIVKPGALIRVKAPRQMGKSSLMSRVLHYASQQGYRTASLNFQSADSEFLASLDKFLQWFCAIIARELELDDKLADYWKPFLGSKDRCTEYFQRYLLRESTNPLALGLDEVDQIFQHPEIATDFLGLLRAWHEKGKNQALWQRLRFVIVHSKEVYIPLNINQSPFNVGLPIELPELNLTQVQELVRRHGLDWSEKQFDQLMLMMGGHPYLVRVALYQIARGKITLEKLLQVAPTEEGPYYDHLRRHLLNLEENASLVAAIKQVVAANHPVEIKAAEAFKLRSMGLVKFQGNAVTPLCEMYRQYFRDRLSS
ncbi:MAG TPA: serine/threonine protein kinase [Cyanobacteria bacterium UBA8553]|nr:serine/threonine protein kinase [Cyanobacteria bacterium UBA8553]